MKNLHIRWLIRRNLPAVMDIERMSFEQPWDEFNFLHMLSTRTTVAMVAEIDHQVLGYFFLSLYGDSIEIENLAVHPEYRRCGIGSQLLDKIKSKLNDKRNKLIAITAESNLRSQLFLKSQGLCCTRILRDFYHEDGREPSAAYVFQYSSTGIEKFEFSAINCMEVMK